MQILSKNTFPWQLLFPYVPSGFYVAKFSCWNVFVGRRPYENFCNKNFTLRKFPDLWYVSISCWFYGLSTIHEFCWYSEMQLPSLQLPFSWPMLVYLQNTEGDRSWIVMCLSMHGDFLLLFAKRTCRTGSYAYADVIGKLDLSCVYKHLINWLE